MGVRRARCGGRLLNLPPQRSKPAPRVQRGVCMSTPGPHNGDFFRGDWGRLEQVVERFEEAWQRGERPALDDYLTAAEVEPRQLVLELAHADLECRLKSGEPARVE